MSFNAAKRCFQENLALFGNAQAQPEKFNLYNGLANLAIALSQLQTEIQRLKNEVDDLKRHQR